MENDTYIIKQLQKGDDYPLRDRVSILIKEVIDKSYKGEIGFGDFVGEIRNILDNMETIAKANYKD